jgi:hypothetical protein
MGRANVERIEKTAEDAGEEAEVPRDVERGLLERP